MDRFRHFAFELYPESMQENAFSFIESLKVKTAVSPLHDSDIFEDDTDSHKVGDKKKPHYHIIFSFIGSKSYNQVLKLVSPLGVNHLEVVNDIRQYSRYLIHFDNPEKAQYKKADVILFNGFDYEQYFLASSQIDKVRGVCDIIQDVYDLQVFEFDSLVDYYISLKDYKSIEILSKNAYFVRTYLNCKKGV